MRPRRMGRRAAARRVLWRLWPDRNPLRRRADHIERLLIMGLIALFAAAAPVVAMAVAHEVAAGAAATARAEPATWHRVAAHVQRSAPPPAGPANPASYVAQEPAWWTAPGGAQRSGEVLVPGGTQAGSVVPVWVDRAGRLVRGPLTRAGMPGGAAGAGRAAAGRLGSRLGGDRAAVDRAPLGSVFRAVARHSYSPPPEDGGE